MTDDAIYEKFFPFNRLGLRKNPFGTLTTDEWVAVTVPSPALSDLLQAGFDHLQIIGHRGRGKTTALHWLCHQFRLGGQAVAYERLPRWQFNYHTDIQSLDIFALDEAQRLFILNQRRLFRDAQGKRLIIGTHVSWARAFRWHGWNVKTLYIAQHTTRDQIRQILDKRLSYFATEDGTQVHFDESAVDYLWERWDDNLRGMEWFLYHVMQKRRDTGAITASDLKLAGADYVEPIGLY